MRHTSLVGSAMGAALVVTLFGLGASPAMAHESLASSSPAEGERFDTAPTVVEMVFTDEVLPLGATVLVVDQSGRNWAEDEVTIDGSTVTVALEPDLPEAGYQVRWRVVSGDGHPISSVIPFSVGDAEPLTGNVDTDTRQDGPAPSEAGEPVQSASPAAPPWATIAIGVAGAALAVALYLSATAVVRRLRAGRPTT